AAPGAGRGDAAVELLVGAAAGHAVVAAAVRAAGCRAPGPARSLTMYQRRHAKNPHAEAEQFRRRAVLGFAVVVLCLAGLAGWYFKLQVVDHEVYATRSEANRIKPRPVVPGRGMIYDRN